MTETKENETLDLKRVAKIALKTLLNLFIGIMFALMVLFFVAPSFSLKVSKTFGSLKGQEVCYERLYTQSGNITDLYNLIVINDQQNDYENEFAYINQIIKKSNYKEFCEQIDKASLTEVKSKELIPYSCDTNAYIRNQKVECMYRLGEDQTIEVVVQTAAGELSDVSLAVYVDLINDDKGLTENQKTEKIVELMSKQISVGGSFAGTDVILKNRINDLKAELAKEGLTESRKIILQHSLVRIYRAEYLINVYLDNSAEAENYKTLYNQEYAKLVAMY